MLIKDEKGDMLANEHEILEKWRIYFKKLLNTHKDSEKTEIFEMHTAELEIKEPTISEVQAAIKKLKNNKAPGIDAIPAEMIKYGGYKLAVEIHKLVCKIWTEENSPEKWTESIIIPIFKKGDKTDCNNYRGISLLSTSHKILSNIILNRLLPYSDDIIGDYQCGFKRNRSTSDQMFAVRQLIEKNWEYNKPFHQLFVDFIKAYDSIIKTKMYQILITMGIPKKLVKMIQVCIHDNKGRVRVTNELSNPFEIREGLKQGDALSPLLFNLVLEYVIRYVQESKTGVTLNGTTQVLAYADDLDILGDNEEIVKENSERLITKAKEVGLDVSEEKTKYMINSRRRDNPASNLKVLDKSFGRVYKFKYLGTIITENNDTKEEI